MSANKGGSGTASVGSGAGEIVGRSVGVGPSSVTPGLIATKLSSLTASVGVGEAVALGVNVVVGLGVAVGMGLDVSVGVAEGVTRRSASIVAVSVNVGTRVGGEANPPCSAKTATKPRLATRSSATRTKTNRRMSIPRLERHAG
jgi:hypothetical protein